MKSFPMLEAEGVTAAYMTGRDVLHGIDLVVNEHEIVTVLGSNGAGKSSLISVISGLLRPRSGRVTLAGEDITRAPAHTLAALGLVTVPSGRKVFGEQTVEENLLLGAHHYRRDRARVKRNLEAVYEKFDLLADKAAVRAGALSGGQQQILSIARALMARPKMLIMDEPSMGLDPVAVRQVFALISQVWSQGVTVLLVEKLAHLAADVSHRLYVMELGRVTLTGPSAELARDPRVEEAYLGRSSAGRSST